MLLLNSVIAEIDVSVVVCRELTGVRHGADLAETDEVVIDVFPLCHFGNRKVKVVIGKLILVRKVSILGNFPFVETSILGNPFECP